MLPLYFKEIGHDYDKLLQKNSVYVNTCAVRMSLALMKSDIPFSGRLKIKDGPHKGKMIEPGAKLLADQLTRPVLFGKPDVFSPKDAMTRLRGKKGDCFVLENYRFWWWAYRLVSQKHAGMTGLWDVVHR